MLKRTLSLILALILCMGVLAGCEQKPVESTQGTTAPAAQDTTAPAVQDTTAPVEDGPLFKETVTIEILQNASSAGAWDENSYIATRIKELLNVDFEVSEMSTGFTDAYRTRLADGDVPDITWLNANMFGNEFGPQGAYINILDYLDQMPNVAAMLETYPDAYTKFKNEDGALYHLATPRTDHPEGFGFYYRADILAKHNLEVPTTQDELYELLKELKALYPDSYPFAMRRMTGNMQGLLYWAPSWGTDLPIPAGTNTYYSYDYETNEFYWGGISDEMKEMVSFMYKLYDEGLMHPSFLTMDNNAWKEAMSNGTSFLSFDSFRTVASIDSAGKTIDPNYELTVAPPIAMGTNGDATSFAQDQVQSHSFLISAQCEDLDSVLKYVDWLYSEEAIELCNWGVEGETFEYDANGNRVWMESALNAVAEGKNIQSHYHLAMQPLYAVMDSSAVLAYQTEEFVGMYETLAPYRTTPVQPTLSYTADEQKIIDEIAVPAFTHTKEEISKFLVGERDLAEWDEFVAEVLAYGIEEQVKPIHEAAYERKYG